MKAPITPEHLCDLVLLDDVRVSPDGQRVAFVRVSVDRANNTYVRNVWVLDLTQPRAVPQPFTAGNKDTHPRWSPDGRWLGFISGRGEKPAIYALPLGGGEARLVIAHLNGIEAFSWSPDARQVAFTAKMRPDECDAEDAAPAAETPAPFKDAWTLKREKEQKQHEEELRLDPRVIRRVPYRTGTTFIDDRYAHIYVVPMPQDAERTNAPKPRRLTPRETWQNFGAPQWSADGKTIYSTYSRDPESGELFRYVDLVRLDPRGKTPIVRRWALKGFSCYNPLPSPDGRWIAFERSEDDPAAYQPATLAIRSTRGERVIDLTAALDRTLGEFRWSPDGAYLYFTLQSEGNVQLWRVRVPQDGEETTPQPEQLTRAVHEITSFDVLPDGRVVFAASTPQDPSALYLLEHDGRTRPLYRPNARFLGAHAVGSVEPLRYRVEGRTIQGWLLKPADFDPSRRYPLVVQMHGGPHVMWGPSTRSMWHEFQTMLSAGYLVFFCNPRGSDGYGRAFWHANRGDWGDGPMRDVLRGVDLLCERPYVDTQRLCITGGSYAGYLTAWIIGKDHRFAAACAQRGVYNLVSMRNTTDVPFFNDREAGGITPWDDVQRLWAMSPISLAPNIQTPLLIEHSEQDYRVPIEQAEQLFQALKLMGKTVELIRWPREGHELSRSGEPNHRIERIRRIIQWFNTHAHVRDLQAQAAGEPAGA